MTNLEVVMLSNNYFNNHLPDVSKLTNLKTLLLDDNNFAGTVTTKFNSLTSLEYLFLQGNNFFGKIDANFLKDLSKLKRLDISSCNFTGEFPSHFFTMTDLELIDLHENHLTGTLPSNIATNTALKYLSLENNLIRGQLNPTLRNLTKLFHLDVSNNTMTGPITARLGQMPLSYLFLANNNFDAGPIPTMFGQLKNLTEISLKGTNRTGAIPAWIGTSWSKLRLLDLDNNHFNSTIPPELGLLTDLEFLLLNRNLGINGTMPTQLNKLSSLRSIFLDSTSLSGNLTAICSLPKLDQPGTGNAAQDTNEFVIADCGGKTPKVHCNCCDKCCAANQTGCNPNTAVASIDPNWETSFQRVDYNFGTNVTNFGEA
jgi:Leucine-rich repeat (LRR) protein